MLKTTFAQQRYQYLSQEIQAGRLTKPVVNMATIGSDISEFCDTDRELIKMGLYVVKGENGTHQTTP